jgi:molybdate transport system ATP-binding protein
MLQGFRVGDSSNLLWAPGEAVAPATRVRIRILARDVGLALSERADSTTVNRLRGVIESVDEDATAPWAMVRVRCGEILLLSRVSRPALQALQCATGTPVWCEIASITVIAEPRPEARH